MRFYVRDIYWRSTKCKCKLMKTCKRQGLRVLVTTQNIWSKQTITNVLNERVSHTENLRDLLSEFIELSVMILRSSCFRVSTENYGIVKGYNKRDCPLMRKATMINWRNPWWLSLLLNQLYLHTHTHTEIKKPKHKTTTNKQSHDCPLSPFLLIFHPKWLWKEQRKKKKKKKISI